MTPESGMWYVTTALFSRGGHIVAGPFGSRWDAQVRREQIEVHPSVWLWIDQYP